MLLSAATASSELSGGHTDPSTANGLLVKLTAGTLLLVSILQNNHSEARVLASLDVDRDVGLLDFEALEKLDDSALVGGPRETTNLDCALDVVFSDAVATSHVLVLKVEGLKLSMVLDIAVVQQNPSATDFLLLLLLESSLRIFTGLEQHGAVTSFSLGLLVHLVLDRTGHHVVAVEELGNLFISSLERQA